MDKYSIEKWEHSMENYYKNTDTKNRKLQECANNQTYSTDLQHNSYVIISKQNVSKNLPKVISETFKNQGLSLYCLI